MSGAVCPSCGVAVLPGYARCPKCRKPLPRRRLTTQVEGGTALADTRRFPVVALIAAGVLGAGVIVWLGTRGGASEQPRATPNAEPTEEPAANPPDPPQAATAPEPATMTANNEQAASEAAGDLERALKREKLWSTVSVIGGRVDVRSSSCSDAKLGQLLDGAAPTFKAAGLTKLRCLEQSGVVVSARDL